MTMVKGFEDVSENELMENQGGIGPVGGLVILGIVGTGFYYLNKAWNESNGLPSSSGSSGS